MPAALLCRGKRLSVLWSGWGRVRRICFELAVRFFGLIVSYREPGDR